ncbi:DUF305 domain-containing protein [Amycolatopsis anabasis]|uniref:DUF305 domain-containing protein n=1 Tax=Amycolatopsis anabasis TaxID=1840409 RepID=UPI001FECAE5B|nr:DUF305 domain-containing protein [Amycolatopsis anabasis]
MLRHTLAVLIGLVACALSGCSMTEAADPAAPNASGANQADIRFSQDMIPHHRQSIQIAELAVQRGISEFVKAEAGEIIGQETAEIETMSRWLRAWNIEVPAGTGHSGHAMPGMLSAGEIASLENSSGTDFDRRWLTAMAKHLRNGVGMASTVLASGQHPETKALAQDIVAEQGKQVAAINEQLARS